MTNKTLNRTRHLAAVAATICFLHACNITPRKTFNANTPSLTKVENKEPTVLLPTAVKINDESVTSEDFENLVDRYIITDSTSTDALSKEIIYKQLVYREALAQGYGDDAGINAELKMYRDIIYDNYRVDSSQIRSLAQQAYKNLLTDIEVAHLLVYCSPFEEPEVIAQKRELAAELKNRIEKGTAFEEVAKAFSDDKSTASQGGYMGWYTGLQLVYPLEVAAFELKKNEVSDPIQTKFGFHLIKLLDKRSSRGRVQVKHLLRVVPPKAEGNVDARQKNSIDSLYALTQRGVSFDSLVARFSDDFRTRDNGGVLPEFWIGSREEKVVEEAVFGLRLGQLSGPVRSSAGWHLFKLIEKRPIPGFNYLKQELEAKVTTDSRGEYIEEQWIKDAKEGLNYKPNLSVIEVALNAGNDNLNKGTWRVPQNSDIINSYLFSVNGESIAVRAFFRFVEEMQEKVKLTGTAPKQHMRLLYDKFEKKILDDYAGRNLQEVNRNFKNAISNYQESLVTNNFLNDKVYQKSVADSATLASMYNRNLRKYQYNERAKIIEVVGKDRKAIAMVENFLANGKPYNLKRGIAASTFSKNSSELSDQELNRLKQLVVFLKRNPSYLLEVGGHTDVNENDDVSANRVQTVISYLTQYGIPLTRIKENDFGKTQPVDRFDWQQNQRVTYRFFSNSIVDVERIISDQGFKVEIIEDIFDKTEIVGSAGIEWKLGNYVRTLDDGNIQKIVIEEIYPARTKSFREAKTALIKDYQAELEKQLFDTLSKKYRVDANQSVIRRIIKSKTQ